MHRHATTTRFTKKLSAVFLALLFSAACTGGEGGAAADDRDGSTPGNTGAESIYLEVASSTELTRVQGSLPAPSRKFMHVVIGLANNFEETPIPTAFSLFSLKTDTAVRWAPSPYSASTSLPCLGDSALDIGGAIGCELIFEIGRDETPVELVYDDGTGRTARAIFPSSPDGPMHSGVDGDFILAAELDAFPDLVIRFHASAHEVAPRGGEPSLQLHVQTSSGFASEPLQAELTYLGANPSGSVPDQFLADVQGLIPSDAVLNQTGSPIAVHFELLPTEISADTWCGQATLLTESDGDFPGVFRAERWQQGEPANPFEVACSSVP